jgi:GWxTD domain-containing protein
MKRFILFSLFSLIFCLPSRALDAGLTYATFSSPVGQYVEIYLHIVGSTVEYIPLDSTQYQANVEVIIIFKKGEEIIKFDKYHLSSPISDFPVDFVDLKRYGLEKGKYTLEVSIEDLNREENARSFSSSLNMNFTGEGLEQSDIQLLNAYGKSTQPGPFVKNGYFMEPLPFNFLDKNASRMIFYNEIYGADQSLGENLTVRYFIQEIKDGETSEALNVGHQQYKCRPVNVVLIQKDITKLPSGNYRLTVEIRNAGNELFSAKSIEFQRANPYLSMENEDFANTDLENEFVQEMDEKTLRYCLKAIAPVVGATEVEVLNMVIANKENIEAQRRYLFSFWARQDPNSPQKAFDEYMIVAKAIDEKFRSGFGYGFETDRGWIYMKYGQPDDIVKVDTEPSAPPYEIWSYYTFPQTKQNNVKFLFYNPSLAHNDFVLLHSNARGERNNPQWQLELYSRSPDDIQGTNYRDATGISDEMGRRAVRLFNDF